MAGFIFGGNTGETPESLKRKREIANALAMSAVGHAPRNIGEGLSSIGQALAYRAIAGKADKAATAGQESASAAFDPIVAALGGGGAFPAAPGAPQSSGVDVPTQRVASAFGDQPGPANGYFDAIRSAESGGSDNAKNPLSSATGRYQFTKGTWDGLMTAHPELGLTPDGRTDPTQQERAIRVFTAQNANQLQDAGIQPTGGNLYAAHFLGADGAKNVLTQPDNAAVSSFVGPEVVKANPFLARMTVGQFKQWAASKGGGNAPVAFSGTVPADSSVAMSGPPPGAPAPSATPDQLPDAEALKLLGASPITRDAQGGPSIAMLLRTASNPWLNKNQSAVVSALLQEKLKQQDPGAQLDMRYKQAQLNALENPTKAPTVQQFYDPQTGQPYEAQWNTKTQSWDKVGGNKAASNGISIDKDGNIQIGGPAKPLTEAQSKDTTFFTRGSGALPILDKYGSALTSLPEKTAAGVPGVGNFMKSKEYQQAEQAGLEFLQAILRKDTGAAITPAETAEYGKVYLPQPGDSKEVLDQKTASRHRALAAIKAGLPPTAILALEKAGVDLQQGKLPDASTPKGSPTDLSKMSAPEGVDPNVWEHVPPEKRKLWLQ